MPMVRRHARTEKGEFHYAAAMHVVSGNYIAARRLGVVNGVDYGYTGAVRFVHAPAIHAQLDVGNVVLLSSLGYSANGELLNCNTFDVAVRAAVECGADKVICLHLDEVARLGLPEWLSVPSAEARLREIDPSFAPGRRLAFKDSSDEALGSRVGAGGTRLVEDGTGGGGGARAGDSVLRAVRITRGALQGQTVQQWGEAAGEGRRRGGGDVQAEGAAARGLPETFRKPSAIPSAVMAVYEACRGGVKRAHLVDARLDGGLLLELYSRDGVGTMISADFYEGIRRAGPLDVPAVKVRSGPLGAGRRSGSHRAAGCGLQVPCM